MSDPLKEFGYKMEPRSAEPWAQAVLSNRISSDGAYSWATGYRQAVMATNRGRSVSGECIATRKAYIPE